MMSQKLVRKRRQQLHARDMTGLVAFCFYPLEEGIVNESCFLSILRCKLPFYPFQGPINTLSCTKIILNHGLKSYNFPIKLLKDGSP